MKITTRVANNCAAIRFHQERAPSIGIDLWLGPGQLAELFGELCGWHNCKAVIEADRVRFLHDGEKPFKGGPAAAAGCQTMIDAVEFTAILRELKSVATELQGMVRQDSAPLQAVLSCHDGLHNSLARLTAWASSSATAAELARSAAAPVRPIFEESGSVQAFKDTVDALCDLVRDGRDLEGHYTEGFSNAMQQAEQLLGKLGVEI